MATKTPSLLAIAYLLSQKKAEAATDSAAVAAVASHFWLAPVKDLSEYAGYFLPIFGCAWILIRMGFFLYDRFRGRRHHP